MSLAVAQLPVPTSSQFDMTGFLQEATLDGPVPASGVAHQGGHVKLNGITVTIPAETIVILPANALSWQELFARAPKPWGLAGAFNKGVPAPTTGMAAADCATNTNPCSAPPLTTYEVHVVGNRVGDQYIAGMIDIAQQGLNQGAGFINFIDYDLGELRVGGLMNDANCQRNVNNTQAGGPNCSGARVRINDPLGRYGRATTSPDVRFTVDPDNPTIMAGTGYPMCLPRVAPSTFGAPGFPNVTLPNGDTQCPEENRPVIGVDPISGRTMYNPSFMTANLTSNCANTCQPLPAGTFPDSTLQAPFEVGDFVNYSGALMKDGPYNGAGDGPSVGPLSALSNTYVAADTIGNNIAIYTFPGSNPAYVMIEVGLIGTGGLTVLGAGEAAIRTRFEGMSTDASRSIHLYGIDYNPLDGSTTDRDYGTIGTDPGPLGGVGAVQGRWRFRPPCAPFGTDPATIKFDKQCIMGAGGTFLPPTREVRAVIEGLQNNIPGAPGAVTVANGLYYGQYHAPLDEYIFPENIPGTAVVPNNFEAIPFLAQGGYSSSGINTLASPGSSIVAGQLNPWPGATVPTPACTPVSGGGGGPYSVIQAGTITLSAVAGGDGPFTYAWSAAAGSFVSGGIDTSTLASPTYTAPNTTGPVNVTLTITGACGTVTSNVTVNVTAAAPPTVAHIPFQTVTSGTQVRLTTTATDPDGLKVTYNWQQTSFGGFAPVFNPNPFIGPVLTTQGVQQSSPQFTINLPLGAAGVTLDFKVWATNSAGIDSTPEFTAVTFNPLPDTVTITTAQYRTGKQRLDLTATSSVVSPNVVLTLQPYLTTTGVLYDPAVLGNLFTNTGGGLYTMTLVGAPEPLCANPTGANATPCSARPLVVKSSLGGQSAPTALTNIRQ